MTQSKANQITTKVLWNAKDPSNYQDGTVHKNEQKQIDFKIPDDGRLTMVKPHNAAQKKKKKKRVEKRKIFEKKLDVNTIKMQKFKPNKL